MAKPSRKRTPSQITQDLDVLFKTFCEQASALLPTPTGKKANAEVYLHDYYIARWLESQSKKRVKSARENLVLVGIMPDVEETKFPPGAHVLYGGTAMDLHLAVTTPVEFIDAKALAVAVGTKWGPEGRKVVMMNTKIRPGNHTFSAVLRGQQEEDAS